MPSVTFFFVPDTHRRNSPQKLVTRDLYAIQGSKHRSHFEGHLTSCNFFRFGKLTVCYSHATIGVDLKKAHLSKEGAAKPPVYWETYDSGVANTSKA
jgi:hypothetical protein